MKLYFAGSTYDSIVYKNNALRLQSFFYKKEIEQWWRVSNNTPLFVDSGAFSGFTKGITISIQDYCDFIEANKSRIETYSVLDVIGDYKETQKNLEYMEAQGLKPLPVFHYKSPERELRSLCNYPYIALGGLVPLALQPTKLRAWLDYCFSIVKIDTRIHGFGVNATWAWERYPFYSVDATSWLQSARFGTDKHIKNKRIAQFRSKDVHYLKRSEDSLKKYINDAYKATKLWASRGVRWD